MKTLDFIGASGAQYVAYESLGSYYVTTKENYDAYIRNERIVHRISDAACLEDCLECAKWL